MKYWAKKYLPGSIHKDYDKFSGKSGTPATKIKTPTAPKNNSSSLPANERH